MALKTCDPTLKTAFTTAGITLTPAQEHIVASNTATPWLDLLKNLGALAAKLLPIIIALLGGLTPAPAPAQAKQGVSCPCDHTACAQEVLDSALTTTCLAACHAASCCCEYC